MLLTKRHFVPQGSADLSPRPETRVAPATARQSPTVLIDLVVTNARDEILLRRKRGRSPQDYWCVPGGRLCTDECVSGAFARIAREELGRDMTLPETGFRGVYEHLNVSDPVNDEDLGAHLIALVYRISLVRLQTTHIPRVPHRDSRWMSPADIVGAHDVHRHIKKYFCRDAAVAR
jgi:colanic acid biosynthesis protein WcaH